MVWCGVVWCWIGWDGMGWDGMGSVGWYELGGDENRRAWMEWHRREKDEAAQGVIGQGGADWTERTSSLGELPSCCISCVRRREITMRCTQSGKRDKLRSVVRAYRTLVSSRCEKEGGIARQVMGTAKVASCASRNNWPSVLDMLVEEGRGREGWGGERSRAGQT